MRFVTATGKQLWARSVCQPQVVDGEVVSLLGTFQDITERKQVERHLQESEERFKSIVHSSPLSIVMIGLDGKVNLANAAAAKLHGYTDAESMVNIHVADLCDNDGRGVMERFQQQVMREGVVQASRVELRRRDGSTFPAEMSISPIHDSDGEVAAFVGMAENISDQLRHQEELSKSAKLESVGVLAGGIAHDFNNILTAIIGNISFARLEANPDSEIARCLDEAEAASQRAAQLTNQLLTFARGGAPALEATSITDIISESARFALRGTGIKSDFQIQNKIPAVNADAGQISQVINNLMINASQAMAGSGTITISVESVTIQDHESLSLEPGDYVRTTIADEGAGISEEHLGKIFDPYFTTKEKGSGLGLASTYSIIKRHRGHITVDSTVGAGTTFNIYLPVAAAQPDHPAATTESIALHSGKGRILVVDDEKAIRAMARAVLNSVGFEVELAENGDVALKMYRQALAARSHYDVVIIDLTMPGGISGKELIGKLLDIDPEVRAIVASGYSNDEVIASYREFGFTGRIAKPFTAGNLSQVVQDAISQSPATA